MFEFYTGQSTQHTVIAYWLSHNGTEGKYPAQQVGAPPLVNNCQTSEIVLAPFGKFDFQM